MKPIACKLAMMAMSLAATSCLILGGAAAAEIPASLVTPDKVETSIGTLEFKDGAPSPETMQKVYVAAPADHRGQRRHKTGIETRSA
jgi:hypothetical protein